MMNEGVPVKNAGGKCAAYHSGNADKYATKNPLKRRMVRAFNAKLLETAAVLIAELDKPEIKILDAGCGEGFIARMLHARFAQARITGLEYNEAALEVARCEEMPSICYVQGDITKAPFEDGAFDLVVCTEVLEHLREPRCAVRELLRVSSGYVLLSVPDEPWFCMGNMLALKNLRRFGNPPDHINHWTYGGFRRFIVRETGEKTAAMRSFPWSIVYLQGKGKA